MSNLDYKHFNTVAEFKGYLKTKKPQWWLKKVIVHHTYSPTVAQWNGKASYDGILKYYTDQLGWDGFPHVFAAPDGVWTMNDVEKIGIHSNAANSFAIAVEVVGDYDKVVWQEPVYSIACGVYAALLEWANLDVADLEPHRKYNPEKTCPGAAIQMPWVQQNVKKFMNKTVTPQIKVWKVKPVDSYAKVRQGAGFSYDEAAKLFSNDIFLSISEKKDEQGKVYDGYDTWEHVTHGYAHMTDDISNTGFVHRSLLEEVT